MIIKKTAGVAAPAVAFSENQLIIYNKYSIYILWTVMPQLL